MPPVLMALEDEYDGEGCSFCGGLGHRITECPKIDSQAKKISGSMKDSLAGGSGGYGGDW